jgi:hypothetical protein
MEGKNPTIPMVDIKETSGSLEFTFTAQGFTVPVKLIKDDKDHLKGKMMDTFDAIAVRSTKN